MRPAHLTLLRNHTSPSGVLHRLMALFLALTFAAEVPIALAAEGAPGRESQTVIVQRTNLDTGKSQFIRLPHKDIFDSSGKVNVQPSDLEKILATGKPIDPKE